MLQTAGLGLTRGPYECESELREECVQTARYRAWEYVVTTSLMNMLFIHQQLHFLLNLETFQFT